MLFDATISLGTIITASLVLIGFIGTGAINAVSVGRYLGAVDKRLDLLDKRMESIEEAERGMTQVIIAIGQQKTEIHLLSKRLDDVQQYGSHRLAEVLEALRGQIMADFKERFEFLQSQIVKRTG